MELWLPINGFESYYEISSLGRIKSLAKNVKNNRFGGIRVIQEKILNRAKTNSSGYRNILLYRDNIGYHKYIHRLVAEHFIPLVDDKCFVNHIDGNKENNCVSNLEWCSQLENIRHSIKIGLSNPKRNSIKVVNLKSLIVYESITSAAKLNGVSASWLICRLNGSKPNTTEFIYYNP